MQLLLFRRLIIYTRYMVPKRLSSAGVFLRKSKMYLHEVFKGSKKITENFERLYRRTSVDSKKAPLVYKFCKKNLSATSGAQKVYEMVILLQYILRFSIDYFFYNTYN